jgi:endonuclease/exonuclease/phosphatase family metal-dependent hydrolase
MAVGTTVSYLLAHTDLCDLDPRLQRTISAKQADLSWAPKTRLAKIDWIFGPRHWKVQRYHIDKDAGSDHRPVIADVIYA